MAIEISIARINDDGLIGSTPDTELEDIDIEASKEAYDEALLAAVTAAYPDATVELVDDDFRGGFGVYVDDDPASVEAQDIVQQISYDAERIYGAGAFWVTK